MKTGDHPDLEDEDHDIAEEVWDRLGWDLDDGDPYEHRHRAAQMAKWTAEERKKLSKADFGDPEHSAFPIRDQEDLEHAAELLHHAKNPHLVKARLKRIASRKGLKLPASWEKSTTMSDPAVFDIEAKGKPDGDEIVYRDALIFRVGDYPDKDFSLTTEEALAAVEQFEPVPNELEHVNSQGQATILDNKLGSVRSVSLSADGQEIRGEVAIPKWLDSVWQGKKQVSAVWDRATKTLQRLGLVVKGRVPDAALMAAFAGAYPKSAGKLFAAAHRTYEGSSVIQRIHNQAAEAGAVCNPGADSAGATYSARFHSSNELKGIQKLHDLAVGHGATCHSMRSFSSPKEGSMSKLFSKFRALFRDDVDPAEAEDVFGELVAMAAKKPQNGLRSKDADTKSGAGKLKADDDEEDEDHAAQDKADDDSEENNDDRSAPEDRPRRGKARKRPAAAAMSDTSESDDLRAEVAALRRENLEAKIRVAASAFAESEIGARRALPSEKASIVACFTQAALDDATHAATVTFAADGKTRQGSRVGALRALFGNRSSHTLFEEFIAQGLPDGATVLMSGPAKDQKPSQERINSLLTNPAYGDLGKRAIQMRNGQS